MTKNYCNCKCEITLQSDVKEFNSINIQYEHECLLAGITAYLCLRRIGASAVSASRKLS